MSPTLGGRRSPDSWSSPHERARVRLAERMTEPLDPDESTWLEAHLTGCAACREVDAAYESDRADLRAMRAVPPPRDLWARTSAALDVEQGLAGGGRRSRPTRRRSSTRVLSFPGRWTPVSAFGSIAALVVVGFIIGNSLIGLSGGAPTPSHGVALGASATPNLVATQNPATQADVSWVSTDSDGSIVVRQAGVSGDCPSDQTKGCAHIGANASNVATLSVKPVSVHQSPTSGQMVVFGQGAGGSGVSMYFINTGKGPSATPTATATPVASTAPPATGSGEPSPSAGSPSPSLTPASPEPTATAVATPEPTSTASIVPNVTPSPSAAAAIAVASDLGVLNAETAAYSPDGVWFAFTAHKLGGPGGSDIYLWHAGDAKATRVTTDGDSVFAGWVGDQLIGSRAQEVTTLDGASPSVAPTADGAATGSTELGVVSFIVDPTTRVQTAIPTAAWRPAVDPTGKFVVYWEGTVARDPESGGWMTASGRLVIRSWPIVATTAPAQSVEPSESPAAPSEPAVPSASGGAGSSAEAFPTTNPKASKNPAGDASASPSESVASSPSSSPSATPSPTPSPVLPSGLPATIATAAGVDWAVAWDADGTHLAIWIGDRGDRSFGHLSLLTIGANGLPSGAALVADRPALPGFALSDGHLAWATPPGVDAEGSQLWIRTYSGKGIGETSGPAQPGTSTLIVVQH